MVTAGQLLLNVCGIVSPFERHGPRPRGGSKQDAGEKGFKGPGRGWPRESLSLLLPKSRQAVPEGSAARARASTLSPIATGGREIALGIMLGPL